MLAADRFSVTPDKRSINGCASPTCGNLLSNWHSYYGLQTITKSNTPNGRIGQFQTKCIGIYLRKSTIQTCFRLRTYSKLPLSVKHYTFENGTSPVAHKNTNSHITSACFFLQSASKADTMEIKSKTDLLFKYRDAWQHVRILKLKLSYFFLHSATRIDVTIIHKQKHSVRHVHVYDILYSLFHNLFSPFFFFWFFFQSVCYVGCAHASHHIAWCYLHVTVNSSTIFSGDREWERQQKQKQTLSNSKYNSSQSVVYRAIFLIRSLNARLHRFHWLEWQRKYTRTHLSIWFILAMLPWSSISRTAARTNKPNQRERERLRKKNTYKHRRQIDGVLPRPCRWDFRPMRYIGTQESKFDVIRFQ